MEIKKLKIEEIKPYPKNAKKHPQSQVELVAKSIREYGFNQPIVVDKNNEIIVGHCRYEAAKLLDLKEVPVLKLENLTEEQVKGYRLMDNKSNESDWDMQLVIEELKDLNLKGFDIDLTGFERDLLIEPDVKDDVIPDNAPTRAKLGDIWQLGRHRVMCGDSTKKEDVERLMDGNKADMVFTDPPYGLGGYAGRSGKFNPIIGDKDIDIKKFYDTIPKLKERYIWGNWKTIFLLQEFPRDVIVWRKNNIGMGRGYRGQYELCFYFGSFKGTDTDVWDAGRDYNLKHPTQKPVCLAERAIKNSSKQDNIILDLFLGSGSTLIACEKTNRICYGMEIDPQYVDVIIQRWENYTGQKAVKIE